VDPPAQRPVKPGNTERLRFVAFLLWCIGQPKVSILPSVASK
jgi:hypothetical protein